MPWIFRHMVWTVCCMVSTWNRVSSVVWSSCSIWPDRLSYHELASSVRFMDLRSWSFILSFCCVVHLVFISSNKITRVSFVTLIVVCPFLATPFPHDNHDGSAYCASCYLETLGVLCGGCHEIKLCSKSWKQGWVSIASVSMDWFRSHQWWSMFTSLMVNWYID